MFVKSMYHGLEARRDSGLRTRHNVRTRAERGLRYRRASLGNRKSRREFCNQIAEFAFHAYAGNPRFVLDDVFADVLMIDVCL